MNSSSDALTTTHPTRHLLFQHMYNIDSTQCSHLYENIY